MKKLKLFLPVLFLLVVTFQLTAQKVSLSFTNVPLEIVLNSIKQQTGLSLVYSDQLVDVNKKVSVNTTAVDVQDALRMLLKNTNLDFEIRSRKLYLTEKKKMNDQPGQPSNRLRKITGMVTDAKGEPIIGGSVIVKGSGTGTTTNINGQFSLEVPDNSVITLSYLGYKDKSITINKSDSYRIILEEDTKTLEEVIVVGYGTQRKGNLTGSISQLKSEKLAVAPVANVTNALAGQLPGLVTKQTSGLPGSDGASINIRGFGSPLVIVDGIESSFNNLDATQIESISILKDGAASIYGARAGNGVVLVTTKRGTIQKPTVTLNTSYTLQGATDMIKPASSGQRATIEREAWIQAGNPEAGAPFTEDAIKKYFAGNDPAYPNTDWFDYTFRNWAPQQNHNIAIRGGNENVRYNNYFGYTNQETMIKKNGGSYERYNVQLNTDVNINKNLIVSVDLNAIYETRDFPIRGLSNGGNTWQDYWNTKPWYPATLPDPTKIAWGGIDVGSVAVTTNMDLSGYRKQIDRNLRSTVTLSYDFGDLIKGLKGKAFVNYNDNSDYVKEFTRPVTFYTYNNATQQYTMAGTYNTKAMLSQYLSRGSVLTQQYSLNYENTFGKVHKITALALYELINYANNGFNAGRRDFITPTIEELSAGSTEGMTTGGSASEMGRVSWIGRLNYSLLDRYLIETIIRADASAKFPANKRWGYFPSVSLGWIMSQEPFMQGFTKLDNLKLRASYGESGNDAVGNFAYLTGYGIAKQYLFGSGVITGIAPKGLPNPDLTWEKMKIFNAGIDFSFLKRNLYGTLEGFYRTRDGIPGTRVASLPSTFGASLPTENLNKLSDRGFELTLGTANKIGKFSYDISGNIAWSRAKWEHYDEPVYTDPDQARINKRTGRWTDITYGYLSDKLFTSQDQIDALKFVYKDLGGNSKLRPGDIRYIDVNKDGFLDWKDQQLMGAGSLPHWTYGINGTLRYGNFDLAFLFQGAFGYNTMLKINTMVASDVMYKLRWTEAGNDENALIPRIGGVASDAWNSDYYYKSVSYIRLKNTSLGYNLPSAFLRKNGVNNLRLYLAGTNLLTFSTISKYGVDPEAPGDNITKFYPQQRTISVGANITF